MTTDFDIIIVGGGHAGTEAAAVAARMGLCVALVSFDKNMIGAMSCNPAIGGLGKGHLVREVDAFDGLIGRAADDAAVHYRMLNASKGAAVQGPRIQADRKLFKASIQAQLAGLENVHIIEAEAAALHFLPNAPTRVAGFVLGDGSIITSTAVVLATGTFLGGKLFRGEERLDGHGARHREGRIEPHDLPIEQRGDGGFFAPFSADHGGVADAVGHPGGGGEVVRCSYMFFGARGGCSASVA